MLQALETILYFQNWLNLYDLLVNRFLLRKSTLHFLKKRVDLCNFGK